MHLIPSCIASFLLIIILLLKLFNDFSYFLNCVSINFSFFSIEFLHSNISWFFWIKNNSNFLFKSSQYSFFICSYFSLCSFSFDSRNSILFLYSFNNNSFLSFSLINSFNSLSCLYKLLISSFFLLIHISFSFIWLRKEINWVSVLILYSSNSLFFWFCLIDWIFNCVFLSFFSFAFCSSFIFISILFLIKTFFSFWYWLLIKFNFFCFFVSEVCLFNFTKVIVSLLSIFKFKSKSIVLFFLFSLFSTLFCVFSISCLRFIFSCLILLIISLIWFFIDLFSFVLFIWDSLVLFWILNFSVIDWLFSLWLLCISLLINILFCSMIISEPLAWFPE